MDCSADFGSGSARLRRRLSAVVFCLILACSCALFFADREAQARQLLESASDTAGEAGAPLAEGGGEAGSSSPPPSQPASSETGPASGAPEEPATDQNLAAPAPAQDPLAPEQTTAPVTEPVNQAAAPVQEGPVYQDGVEPVLQTETPVAEPVQAPLETAETVARPVVEPVVEPVASTAQPVIEGATPAVDQTVGQAGTNVEPVIEPVQQTTGATLDQVNDTAEPVLQTAGPAVDTVHGTTETIVEPVQQTPGPTAAPEVAAELPAADPPVTEPPMTEPPVPEDTVVGPEAETPAPPEITPAAEVEPQGGAPAAGETSGRAVESVRPIPEAPALRIAREAVVPDFLRAASSDAGALAPGNPSHGPETREQVSAALEQAGSSALPPALHLGTYPSAEGLAIDTSLGAGNVPRAAPQPLAPGGVPAGLGTTGGLGTGSVGFGVGLAVLALLLFLFRAGGSLSWLSCEILGPSSGLVRVAERPG